MSNLFSKALVASVLCAIIGSVAIVTPAHATSTSCVDGSTRSNLSVTWNSANKVSVHTVSNKPLCADTTLFFSSYTMPDGYNGKPFSNNPTASPQSIFDSTSVVLKKDTTGTSTFTIKLPEACKNIQVDLYYAPQITTVTAKGHGAQYITGKILPKTAKECTPTTTPPVVPPTEAETPPTPTPVVQVAAPAPVVAAAALPETGTSLAGLLAAGAAISTIAYAIAYTLKRQ